MNKTQWPRHWRVYSLVGALMVLALLIMACGGDDATETPTQPPATATMAPSTPAPTMAPAATMAPSTPAPTAAATRAPTRAAATPVATATAAPAPTTAPAPQATARPTPAATPTVAAARVPVSPRLKVTTLPPSHQVTMMWQTFQGSTGPIKAVYEMLIYQDRFSGEYTNDQLATEWSMSPDAKTWSFKLRKDVPFHSTDTYEGTDFTAKDVVLTIRTLSRDDALATTGVWTRLGIDDDNFEIPNDNEFIYHMDVPQPQFNFWASEEWVAGIISQDYLDAVGMDRYLEQPIGTGPFKFVELDLGSSILHERVENHWRKTPEFHELHFIYSTEDATRLAMLITKEAHISNVPRSLLPQLEQRGFKVASSTLPGFYFFYIFSGQYHDGPRKIRVGEKKGETFPVAPGYDPNDPFRDVRVRKALNLAVNRDAIRDAFFPGGSTLPMSVHNIPPYRSDFKSEWTPYPYDPEEAKRLLAEAGYPNGFDFTFRFAINAAIPEYGDVTEAVAAQWQEIGLRPKLEIMETSAVNAGARTGEWNHNIYTWGQATGPFPIGICFRMNPVAGGCGGGYFFDYDAMDDVYFKLTQAVLPEDILQYTQEMGDWMYENFNIIPMFFLNAQVAFDPGVLVDYQANHLHFGPTRHHEFTVPVYQ